MLAVVLPVACGLIRLSYETNYINLFRAETRVVGDYHKVEIEARGHRRGRAGRSGRPLDHGPTSG